MIYKFLPILFFINFTLSSFGQKDVFIIIDEDIKYKYDLIEEKKPSKAIVDTIRKLNFTFPNYYLHQSYYLKLIYSNIWDFDTIISPLVLDSLETSKKVILFGKDLKKLSLPNLYYKYLDEAQNIYVGYKNEEDYIFYRIKTIETNYKPIMDDINYEANGSTNDVFFYEQKRKNTILVTVTEKYSKASYNFIKPDLNNSTSRDTLFLQYKNNILSHTEDSHSFNIKDRKSNKRSFYSFRLDTGETYWFLSLKTIINSSVNITKTNSKIFSIDELQFLKFEKLQEIFGNKKHIYIVMQSDGKDHFYPVEFDTNVNYWIKNSL